MRGAIGLVGILVVCGVIALWWGKVQHPADTVRQGKAAQDQARDISGREFLETVKLEAHDEGGRHWMQVMSVDPTGPGATYYGLLVGDRIVKFGEHSVATFDAAMSKDLIPGVYRHPTEKQPLIVIRNGQRIQLPGAIPVP